MSPNIEPFSLKVEPAYVIVTMEQPVLDTPEAKQIVNRIRDLTERRPLIILDFHQVKDIAPAALRLMMRINSLAAERESRLAVVCESSITRIIRDLGLDRLFPCYNSLAVVPGIPVKASKEQTREFLNTTLEAVTYTLKVSAATDLKAGQGYLVSSGPMPTVDVGAMVGIVSLPFSGSLVLAFSMKTYLTIMSRMLGQEYKEITPEIADGVAELLNMILGQAKTTLNEKGFGIKQAIPTVVQGEKIKIFTSSSTPTMIVPFSCDDGEVFVALATNVRKDSN